MSWQGGGWSNGGWGGGSWSGGSWSGSGDWGQSADSWSGGQQQGGGRQNGGGRSKGKGKRGRDEDGGDAPRESLPPLSNEEVAKLQSFGSKVKFCPDPVTMGGRFTATYERSPPADVGNFGSLNAGDKRLFVGGKTMNGQFAKDLQNTTKSGQPWEYEKLHQALLASCKEEKTLVGAPDTLVASDPNVKAAFARANRVGDSVGACLIDIFKDDCKPHGSPQNAAMVYTCGPARKDYPSDSAFLLDVRGMASNISAACTEYNELRPEVPLNTLRVCLVSGGAFAGRVPKAHVAQMIIMGLADSFHEESSPVFEFSFDGDVFKGTWEGLLSSA